VKALKTVRYGVGGEGGKRERFLQTTIRYKKNKKRFSDETAIIYGLSDKQRDVAIGEKVERTNIGVE